MAAKGKAPPAEPPRTITELEAELERRTAERDEALARESAIAEVLQVINSSLGDLTPVFDTIVEKAMRLCEAAHGHLWIYDGERAHPVAVRGDPRLVEWMNQRGVSPVLPASGPGAIGRILGGERYAHITDVLADEAYRSLSHFREMVDHGGIRTLLDVPLRKERRENVCRWARFRCHLAIRSIIRE
jgi:two-component system NtrC family sensor kinase